MDEDEDEVGDKLKIYCYFQNCYMKIVVPKPLGFMKLSHFSEMQDDALMHREGLKG